MTGSMFFCGNFYNIMKYHVNIQEWCQNYEYTIGIDTTMKISNQILCNWFSLVLEESLLLILGVMIMQI